MSNVEKKRQWRVRQRIEDKKWPLINLSDVLMVTLYSYVCLTERLSGLYGPRRNIRTDLSAWLLGVFSGNRERIMVLMESLYNHNKNILD